MVSLNVEGLMPGQYRVGIECWKLPPSKDNPRGVSYLPAKYCNASTSGIELTIAPGDSPKELTLDVPAEKSKTKSGQNSFGKVEKDK